MVEWFHCVLFFNLIFFVLFLILWWLVSVHCLPINDYYFLAHWKNNNNFLYTQSWSLHSMNWSYPCFFFLRWLCCPRVLLNCCIMKSWSSLWWVLERSHTHIYIYLFVIMVSLNLRHCIEDSTSKKNAFLLANWCVCVQIHMFWLIEY